MNAAMYQLIFIVFLICSTVAQLKVVSHHYYMLFETISQVIFYSRKQLNSDLKVEA